MVPGMQEVEAGGSQRALELKASLGCLNGAQPENKLTKHLNLGVAW